MFDVRRILLSLALFALGAAIASQSFAAGGAWTGRVTLLVFSDIYEMAGVDGRGGFARVAGTIAAERTRGGCTILAHAGDTLSPSLMSGIDKGAHIIEMTNRIAPDVFVPGNHEFDFGEEIFRQRMSEARFPLLAANLRQASGELLPGFADNKIIECDGVRVGVFGLTDDEAVRRSSPGSLKVGPAIATAKEQAGKLRAAGADIVVLVAHTAWQDDLRLAGLGVIDVVLSGHDHNLWVGYDGKAVIAESQSDGLNVVAVDLSVTVKEDNGARKVSWRPGFRVLDTADATPDAEMQKLIDAYQAKLSEELDTVIGTTAVALDSRKASVRNGETAIGNFIADAFREATGADIAIVNGGSIRGDRQYEAGQKITRKDIRKELPFSDKVVVVEMTGADLREALENGVWFAGKGDGRFCQISGARITGRKDAVPGTKLSEILVGGSPLDPAKTYKVAATMYLAAGKDGYAAFNRGTVVSNEDQGRMAVEIVMAAIEKAGTIAPAIDGRVSLD